MAPVVQGDQSQIDAVRAANVPDADSTSYLNVFAVAQIEGLPPLPCVDFSQLFSLHSKCRPLLIKAKAREMSGVFQNRLKEKLAYFFGRP